MNSELSSTVESNQADSSTRARIRDVQKAFGAVPSKATKTITFSASLDSLPTHFQGMALYKKYYIFTHDQKERNFGEIRVINRETKREVYKFEIPVEGFKHPGGCQVVGDYLGIEVEGGDSSMVLFYSLKRMSDTERPTPLGFRMKVGGAGALAITEVGLGQRRRYLMALKMGSGITFFESNGRELDALDLKFTESFRAALLSHGADNLALLTDVNENVFLIGLTGDEKSTLGCKRIEDWMDLYRVDIAARRMEVKASRHMFTSGDRVPCIPFGPHFRYGAGASILDESRLGVYCCERNVTLNPILKINEFGFIG